MISKNILKSLVLIVSMTSVANAYLTPGNGGGGNQPPNPPHYCENPYGPCDQHGNPMPGHGGGHHQPPHQGYPPLQPGYPQDPGYPTDPVYGNREVRSIYIGRSVRNERLPISQMAGLDSQYRGWEVVAVRAQTRPDSPSQTVAQLLSNGRIVASQVNPGYQINLMPNSRIILGSSGLQLAISGSTIIDTVEVEMINNGGNGGGGYNPPQPQSDRIDINIYRSTYGNDRIDLTQYINMYQYQGQRIDSIEIRARAEYNVSIARILINSFDQGGLQFSGGQTQSGSIYLNNRPMIGQGADSIILETRGNMTIESVVIHLSRY